MTIADKLKQLNITLPPVAVPAAAYLPFVRTGNLVFLSGHIAKKDGKPWVGQLGKNMSTDEAKLAARGINVVTARFAHRGDDAGFTELRRKRFDRGGTGTCETRGWKWVERNEVEFARHALT